MATTDAAAEQKGAMRSLTAQWLYHLAANPSAAIAWVNRAPAQTAGQAAFSNRADGQVDVYYFL
jgi:hypothetical protein